MDLANSGRDDSVSELTAETRDDQGRDLRVHQPDSPDTLIENSMDICIPSDQGVFPETPASSTFSGSTLCPPLIVNGVSCSMGDVQVMAQLLNHARQTGEFPTTRFPNLDAVSIV
jgi:hypothetical protein